MLQDVNGFFTVTATTWLPYVLYLAQAKADITNQSWHSFPTAQDTSPGSITNEELVSHPTTEGRAPGSRCSRLRSGHGQWSQPPVPAFTSSHLTAALTWQ